MTVEQMVRDLLTQAMKDDLVLPRDERDASGAYVTASDAKEATARLSSGDLVGTANLLDQMLQEAVLAERKACENIAATPYVMDQSNMTAYRIADEISKR